MFATKTIIKSMIPTTIKHNWYPELCQNATSGAKTITFEMKPVIVNTQTDRKANIPTKSNVVGPRNFCQNATSD
jgi:hypothetical protein